MASTFYTFDSVDHLTQETTIDVEGGFSGHDYASLRELVVEKDKLQLLDESQVLHGPTDPQLSNPHDPIFWNNNYDFTGQQPGTSSSSTHFHNNLANVLEEDFRYNGFHASSAWMPQPVAQDLAALNVQGQVAMLGMGEAQPVYLAEAHFPATSGFVAVPAPPIVPQANIKPHHHCPHGCAKSFRRPGDYRRHMRKHDAPKYKCVEMNCNKTFYRFDKLRDHLKQGHKLTL